VIVSQTDSFIVAALGIQNKWLNTVGSGGGLNLTDLGELLGSEAETLTEARRGNG
jgi:hypothetical protein